MRSQRGASPGSLDRIPIPEYKYKSPLSAVGNLELDPPSILLSEKRYLERKQLREYRSRSARGFRGEVNVRARPRRKDQPVCRGRKFLAGGTAGPLPGVHRAASQELTYTRRTHPSPMRGARIPFPSKVHVNGICSRAQRVDAADAEGRGGGGALRFISSTGGAGVLARLSVRESSTCRRDTGDT